MAHEHEQEILKFWDEKGIYKKSKKQNAKGKKFYFMDGPPYANGHIHMGTALNKSLKDIAMRFKRLQGYDVFDRPGYDTHGVPIEAKVEKEIGSVSKQDIEKYGVEKFVKRCKEFATQHIGHMNQEFKNLGVWMDFENPYLTLDDSYIGAIWNAFKEADKKGLLYLGKYPVHVCTRCGTAVAYNEIEYGKQKDNSVFVKFPVVDEKNKYLIIWTTTPWTLPGNTGVMANPNVQYSEIELSNGESWILASDLVGKIMSMLETGFTIKKEFKGKDLEGVKYQNPLAKDLKLKIKKGYEVILSARYVTTEDGTGLVHCAPGHGKEDYEVGREYGIDAPCPVGIDGLLTEEAGKYAGKKARIVDQEIIEDLQKGGYLVHKMIYEHDYPLCWRDKTPLLMISQPQWFLKISAIHDKLLKENDKTEWVPDYMKLRMKAWLEGIGDWPVSRQRYWGTPLPIWYDPESGERIVVGSLEELEKLSGKKKIDLHKPGIDNIEIVSKKTGKKLKRVSEVLDVWFDSGVSSWAALNYPSEKKEFEKYWPADLNIEGKDQFRGWWNSQLILSVITFGKRPFKSVGVHGMVLDLGKKKMSKSVGNVVSPEDVISKYGRDYIRYYFAKTSKGEDFAYDEEEFKDIGKILMILGNTNNFVNQLTKIKSELEVEDEWILSKYNKLIKEVTESYEKYYFPEAVQKIEKFVMELSRSYIQMIRDRSDSTYDVMREIRLGLLKILSPIIPFYTEKIWKELLEKGIVNEESIHLSSWPKFDKKKIDDKLEDNFEKVLKIIERGLAERDKAKIGLRWPLACVTIVTEKFEKKFEKIVMQQLNVKKVIVKKGEFNLELDVRMNEELEGEGFSREIARKVQAERKNAGLKKGDLIELEVYCSEKLKKMLSDNSEFLKDRTNSKKLGLKNLDEKNEKSIEFSVKEEKIAVSFRNL